MECDSGWISKGRESWSGQEGNQGEGTHVVTDVMMRYSKRLRLVLITHPRSAGKSLAAREEPRSAGKRSLDLSLLLVRALSSYELLANDVSLSRIGPRVV